MINNWDNAQCYYSNIEEMVENLKLSKPGVSDRTIWANAKIIRTLIYYGLTFPTAITDISSITFYLNNTTTNKNTRANQYCAISTLYQSYPTSGGNTCMIESCREHITYLKNDIQLLLDEHKKTVVQENNWVNHKQILKSIKKLGEVSKEIIANGFTGKRETIRTVQNWVIQSLYMLDPENPPVRCDYGMKILYKNQRLSAFFKSNEEQNYLIVNDDSMTFIFNTYKTKKAYGRKVVRVGDELYEVLKLWLIYRNNPIDLLVNTRDKPLSRNNLGKYITEAFSIYNNKLSVDTLRHIFISENINLGNSKKYAKLMMHSIEEQQQYWKHIEEY
tara:strand:- start:11966 stop:12961 length:996 start_codon:yes stop_codon:yes gene_type:complete